jgi:hypothetical protein
MTLVESRERNSLGNFTQFQEEKQQYSMYLHVSNNVKGKRWNIPDRLHQTTKCFQASMGDITNYDKGISFSIYITREIHKFTLSWGLLLSVVSVK